MLAAGAEVVCTSISSEKTLRGLLALDLIVLAEAPLPKATLNALAEFTVLNADGLSSTSEIAKRLLQPQKVSQS